MLTVKDELDAYINSNYTFRCQEKYKGLFGKIRAFWDRIPDAQATAVLSPVCMRVVAGAALCRKLGSHGQSDALYVTCTRKDGTRSACQISGAKGVEVPSQQYLKDGYLLP